MGLVWFVLGLAAGVLGTLYVSAGRRGAGRLRWYEYVVSAVFVAWTVLGLGFAATTLSEGSPRAAGVALLIFGAVSVLGLILLRVLCRPASQAKEVKA